MTRAHHVTHGRTAERLEKIRKLIVALQAGQMQRQGIADLLQLSPTGVRRYVGDLRAEGVMEIARYVDGTATFIGYPEFRLTPDADRVRAYLASLTTAPTISRSSRISELGRAEQDPRRHFHIAQDDEHIAVRVLRTIPAHEPVHAAFWRMGSAEQRL